MQIISRSVSESIVIGSETKVTVVEVLEDEVTLEVSGPDGQRELVTLPAQIVSSTSAEESRELAAV